MTKDTSQPGHADEAGEEQEPPLEGTIEGTPRPPRDPEQPTENEHPSDYPGREYPDDDSLDRSKFTSTAERSHSSGVSNPSEPRRPGTGERQAPLRSAPTVPATTPVVPGEILLADTPIEINAGLEVTTLQVANTADRPIQVGSHFHFFEVNAALDFDRQAAWGKRLNVLSGGAVRFEPGALIEIELIPIQGQRIVRGLRGLTKGALDG